MNVMVHSRPWAFVCVALALTLGVFACRAPESSVTFRGNGQNIVYVDWENDLVVVVRWIRSGDALNEFIGRVLASINRRT